MTCHAVAPRQRFALLLLGLAALSQDFPASAAAPAGDAPSDARPPNVIVIFADDLGYGDLGCYGAADIPTPHLDRMAAEGVRFTDFYVPSAVCTPSRAGLLTGCHPVRVDLSRVLHPHEHKGINPAETTIAEMLKARGYATGVFGKWHLGHRPAFLPPAHGFDESLVIPYSHDMYRGAPWAGGGFTNNWPDYVPLLRDGTEAGRLRGLDDFETLTARFTEAGVDFIRRHRDQPFFLYLPQPMPHLEIRPPRKWRGVSQRGPYGDVVAELDASVGTVLSTLKELGLDERTLVVFSSDNGPAAVYQKPPHAGGSAGPLSGRKATWHEGGLRVPCLMRWPGHVPAGTVCREVATVMDLLPTLAALCGATPPDRKIDGRDVRALMTEPATARSPHEAFYYYRDEAPVAVRSGDWKLWVRHTEHGPGGKSQPRPARLYHLRDDVAEARDVAADHPDVVERLERLANAIRGELGDRRRNQPAAEAVPGREIRRTISDPPARVPAGRAGAPATQPARRQATDRAVGPSR